MSKDSRDNSNAVSIALQNTVGYSILSCDAADRYHRNVDAALSDFSKAFDANVARDHLGRCGVDGPDADVVRPIRL